MPAPNATPRPAPHDRVSESSTADAGKREQAAGVDAAMAAPLPTFTIVVPTYNRPRELATCLAALAALDYPVERYEIVVVDDGSDPPVASIADPGRPGLRIRGFRQPNAGPSAARNAGARAATGNILAFTDDDCAPERDWLRAIAAAVSREPGALHGGAVANAFTGNVYAAASQTILDVVVPYLIDRGSAQRFVTSNNLALSADRFRASGGFDERFRWSEDREFCRRWLIAGRPIARAPSAVVKHRHDLTLRTFCRQHFGYGRGAYDFHRIRAAAGSAPLWPGLPLLAKIFGRPFTQAPLLLAMRIAALLVVWQVANTAGYVWQGWCDRRRRPDD